MPETGPVSGRGALGSPTGKGAGGGTVPSLKPETAAVKDNSY